MPDGLAREIAIKLEMHYRLTSYFVMREKDGIEEIFCYAGTDIIYADNIRAYMQDKYDGWIYSTSDEVCVID